MRPTPSGNCSTILPPVTDLTDGSFGRGSNESHYPRDPPDPRGASGTSDDRRTQNAAGIVVRPSGVAQGVSSAQGGDAHGKACAARHHAVPSFKPPAQTGRVAVRLKVHLSQSKPLIRRRLPPQRNRRQIDP